MADPDRDPDDHRRPRQPSPERLKFERRLENCRGQGFRHGRWQTWRDASLWKVGTPAKQAFGGAAACASRVQGDASLLRARVTALAHALLAFWVLTASLLAGWLASARQAARTVVGGALGALRRAPWRRGWQLGALATASGLAMASVLASSGYAEHPPVWVLQRLAERAGHGVFDAEGRLLGATFDSVALPGGGEVDHSSYGHVPAHAPLPALYVRLLLELEHKSHFEAWRNWCGTDLLSLGQRMLTGTGGGSTFAHQLAKQLLEPDVRRSDFGPEALVQKAREWGTGCALHRALGGPKGVLRAFVDTAPVAQVRGTTRGPVSGAQVLFGVPLQQATPAMLAVLASLVQRPLSVVPEVAFSRGCEALRATKGADAQALPPTEKLAKTQCHTLARARVALRAQLPAGAELDAALDQIASW
ncbi:transglycosylase domain-containing protein [Ideonella sp. 4Y16]|uniref:transglycosylase domain-containing protein n=1 Tax=Ideonella alba TaxID=2824118 RepID=UPI001B37ADBA|nr:transglycosylase domain-containing protein [Ideonella alba]MBQ0944044.1 transglycosylase domain-containing protein [Ideonella alba]